MNRLVIIGNGFDLAHGLRTSYKDFIDWYWEDRVAKFRVTYTNLSKDPLCTLKIIDPHTWSGYAFTNIHRELNKKYAKEVIENISNNREFFKFQMSPFFNQIINNVESKGWVDIENEYYDLLTKCALSGHEETTIEELNNQLHFLQEKLIEYLNEESKKDVRIKPEILKKIYSPFNENDIAIERKDALQEHIEYGMKLDDRGWGCKLWNYGNDAVYSMSYINDYKQDQKNKEIPYEFLLPNQIMILNFNYTNIAQKYLKEKECFSINQIHGNLDDTNSVIFGYGDEKDRDYEAIIEKNDNKLLKNIKSIRYLESDNYRKMLAFIESAPFQVCIMGHSCGYSDRTLLSTLFEHKNCVSVKAYYYKKENGTDNYLDIIQNISRNFTDMKLMRDRVVNKVYCEPLINS